MSKKSRFDELNEDIEEDFLDVDKPIQGQNYCCISFVSPEKILAKKEDYYFDQFFKKRMQVFNTKFNEKFEKLLEGDPESVDASLVAKLHKRFLRETKEAAEKCMEDFADFKYANEEAIENNFHQENDLQTSVRGVKVRGVYNTLREAQIRAKVLQRMDPSFHIFVGQVGYWLAWDPTADKIENQEYANKQLNDIVKKYKTNEAKRDMFYEEQKRERKQAKLKKELEKENEGKKEAPVMTISAENEKPALESAVDQALEEVSTKSPKGCEGECPCDPKKCPEKCEEECPCDPKECPCNPEECPKKYEEGECPCDQKEDTSHLEELLGQADSRLPLGGQNDEMIDMDEAVESLSSMDPWMSRKLASEESHEDEIHAPLEEDDEN